MSDAEQTALADLVATADAARAKSWNDVDTLRAFLDALERGRTLRALPRSHFNNWSEDDQEVIRAATALAQYLDGDTETAEDWMGAAAVAVNAAFPKTTP